MAEKTTKEVNIKLTATDTASAVVAGAKKKIDKELGGIDKLKKSFGEESALGNIGKIATGAGAVGALTLIGSAAAGATAKMVELNNEFKAGRINGAQLAEGIMASLPVLGQFWQTGRNIRELMTGEEAAAARRLSAEQSINKSWMDRKALIQQIRELSDPQSEFDNLRRAVANKYDVTLRALQDPLRKQFEAGKISGGEYSKALRENGAESIARERAEALRRIADAEALANARKKPSASYREAVDEMARVARATEEGVRKNILTQAEQGLKAGRSALLDIFAADGDRGAASRQVAQGQVDQLMKNVLGFAGGVFGDTGAKSEAAKRREIQNEGLTEAGGMTGIGLALRESARRDSKSEKLIKEQIAQAKRAADEAKRSADAIAAFFAGAKVKN